MDQFSSDYSDVESKDESSLKSGCDSSSSSTSSQYEDDTTYNDESTFNDLTYSDASSTESENELDSKNIFELNDITSGADDQSGSDDGKSTDNETYGDPEYPGYLIEYSLNFDNDSLPEKSEDIEVKTKQVESKQKYEFDLFMVLNILMLMDNGFYTQFLLRYDIANGNCSTNDDYYYDNRYVDIKSLNKSNTDNNNNNNNDNQPQQQPQQNNNKNNDQINDNNNSTSSTTTHHHNKNIEGLENYKSHTFIFNPVSCSFEFNNNNFPSKSRFSK